MKVTNQIRSKVLSLAHAMRQQQPNLDFGERQKQGWKVIRLFDGMENGVITFKFKKLNGEIRTAKGTLNESLFNYFFKTGNRAKPLTTIPFFDLSLDKNGNAKGWRSFKADLVC